MSRTLIWPAGNENDGTSQYRLYLPAKVLQDQGCDVQIDSTGPIVLWDTDWSGQTEPPANAKVVALARRPEADTIVIQRPGRRWWADLIPMLQSQGIRVVVDIDDHFAHIEKDNAAYSAFHGGDPVHSHTWVAEACKVADLVTCTTKTLADFYGFGHACIIPNYVPASYLDIETEMVLERTVVWTGTTLSHPHDLEVTRGGVGEALKATGWGFHVVGDGRGVQTALRLPEPPTVTGWVPFAEYPALMAEATIGIVPLTETTFNKGKSCLKLMEFSALGVPALATATPDNQRLVDLGIGSVVKHKSQWRKSILRLINSEGYREELAERSREAMREYTYEKQSWRWAEAWNLA